MFLEVRVLSHIEMMREIQKDIIAFEDPAIKSTSAGKRARKKIVALEKQLKVLREEIMEIRRQRVVTGEKKTL